MLLNCYYTIKIFKSLIACFCKDIKIFHFNTECGQLGSILLQKKGRYSLEGRNGFKCDTRHKQMSNLKQCCISKNIFYVFTLLNLTD